MASRAKGGDEEFIDDGVVAEINITPLTDIFLVLLIIFMVTSSAIVDAGGQTGVDVDLPGTGAGANAIANEADLTVAILEDGSIVTGGQELTMSQLEELFDTSVQVAGVRTLVIQADKGVPHGRVVEVMESAKQKGLTNLAIATQQQSKD